MNFYTFFSTKWRIGKYHIVTVFFLYVGKVFGKCVGVYDIRCINAMKNHIHNADNVRQRFFLFAVKRLFLQYFGFFGWKWFTAFQIIKSFAKETCRTASSVIYFVSNCGCNHFYNGCNKRSGCVVFSTVSPCIAHVLDFTFVQVAHLMLFCISAKTQLVYEIYNFS